MDFLLETGFAPIGALSPIARAGRPGAFLGAYGCAL